MEPGKKLQKRQQIVATVAQHFLRHGFRNSGIRALAKSAGLSDRMLMYYFETKEELVAEALLFLTKGFAQGLEQILPDRPTSGSRIVRALVDSADNPESRPMLRLWFEIVGLAVNGDEPYRTTARQILHNWETWIAGKLTPNQRHRAPTLLAQVEGEIMLNLLKSS